MRYGDLMECVCSATKLSRTVPATDLLWRLPDGHPTWPKRAAWRELRGQVLAPGRGCTSIRCRAGTNWGPPLMFAYLPDVLTYLAFAILMAACLWYSRRFAEEWCRL